MEREEKLKALDAALGQIEKQFGNGAILARGIRHHERYGPPFRRE